MLILLFSFCYVLYTFYPVTSFVILVLLHLLRLFSVTSSCIILHHFYHDIVFVLSYLHCFHLCCLCLFIFLHLWCHFHFTCFKLFPSCKTFYVVFILRFIVVTSSYIVFILLTSFYVFIIFIFISFCLVTSFYTVSSVWRIRSC